jgi:hypothetical protein
MRWKIIAVFLFVVITAVAAALLRDHADNQWPYYNKKHGYVLNYFPVWKGLVFNSSDPDAASFHDQTLDGYGLMAVIVKSTDFKTPEQWVATLKNDLGYQKVESEIMVDGYRALVTYYVSYIDGAYTKQKATAFIKDGKLFLIHTGLEEEREKFIAGFKFVK